MKVIRVEHLRPSQAPNIISKVYFLQNLKERYAVIPSQVEGISIMSVTYS